MNILYVLGNGFDIAQGLKTKYRDFYPYYISHNSSHSEIIKSMCNEINENICSWSDMEVAFGKYTANIPKENIEEVFYNISDSLREYLINEQKRFDLTQMKLSKIEHNLMHPYMPLYSRDYSEIQGQMDCERKSHTIDIVTFNYTDVLDRIFPEKDKQLLNSSQVPYYFGSLYHLHGGLNDTIILGVDNVSQVSNKDYADDLVIGDFLIKPQSNENTRSLSAYKGKQLISTADIIVIYGCSIGITDAYWWKLIGESLMKNDSLRIILIGFDENPIGVNRKQKIGNKIRTLKSLFFNRASIPEELIKKVESRVYACFDNDYLSTIDL